MAYTTITWEVSDHVGTVTLNRPERLNAFNQEMCDEFVDLWAQVRDDDDVHVVVLRANGDKAFCTGVDVVDGIDFSDNPYDAVDPGALLSPKANRCWKPVVAAVHGMAAGGAFYWLNEADIVICSDDATFFDPHVTYGMISALEPIGLSRPANLAMCSFGLCWAWTNGCRPNAPCGLPGHRGGAARPTAGPCARTGVDHRGQATACRTGNGLGSTPGPNRKARGCRVREPLRW